MWQSLKEERREPNDTEWATVMYETEVSECLVRWRIKNFGKATTKPLAGYAWRKRIDPRNVDNKLEEITDGRFKVPPGMPPEFTEFLH